MGEDTDLGYFADTDWLTTASDEELEQADDIVTGEDDDG